MTTEEQLKTYAAYLPYGVEYTDYEISYTGILSPLNIYDVTKSDNLKLHLWDLSCLTKPIEHKGRFFVPILRVCDKLGFVYTQYTLNNNSVDLVLCSKHHRSNTKTHEPRKVRFWFSNHKGISFNCTKMDLLMYKDICGAVEMLKEFHINIFGIPAGEFIPKTLKTESNDTRT